MLVHSLPLCEAATTLGRCSENTNRKNMRPSIEVANRVSIPVTSATAVAKNATQMK